MEGGEWKVEVEVGCPPWASVMSIHMPTAIHSLRNRKLLPYNFLKANILKLCTVNMTSFYRHSYYYKYHMCSHLKTTCTVTYPTINPTIN